LACWRDERKIGQTDSRKAAKDAKEEEKELKLCVLGVLARKTSEKVRLAQSRKGRQGK
jgi:hypothetical protein